MYVMLGRVFSLLMPGSVAFSITLLSLVSGAVAPALLLLALNRVLPGRYGLIGALLGSASLGFSLHFWSQAVVAEVYALHALLLSIVFFLTLRWMDEVGACDKAVLEIPPEAGLHSRKLLLASYVLGLSFANHMLSSTTLLFFVVILVWAGRRRLVTPRTCVACLALFSLALTAYAFLPIRSARNPELDWGNPETFSQFTWVVTGAQYRFRLFAAPLSSSLSKLWPGPFLAAGWPVLILSALGITLGKLARSLRVAISAMILADLAVVAAYDIPDPAAYFLPASFGLSVAAAFGTVRLLSWAEAGVGRIIGLRWSRHAMTAAAVALLASCVLPSALLNAKRTDASGDLTPYVFGQATFRSVEPDALIVSEYDGRTFALWFFRATEFRESHSASAVVFKYLLVWPWYVENLRRLHPDLAVPDAGPMDNAMVALVSSNIRERTVYAVREDPALLPFFDLVPVLGGDVPLYRVELKPPETQAAGLHE